MTKFGTVVMVGVDVVVVVDVVLVDAVVVAVGAASAQLVVGKVRDVVAALWVNPDDVAGTCDVARSGYSIIIMSIN